MLIWTQAGTAVTGAGWSNAMGGFVQNFDSANSSTSGIATFKGCGAWHQQPRWRPRSDGDGVQGSRSGFDRSWATYSQKTIPWPVKAAAGSVTVNPDAAISTSTTATPTIQILALPAVAIDTSTGNNPTAAVTTIVAPAVAISTSTVDTPTVRIIALPAVAIDTSTVADPTVRVLVNPDVAVDTSTWGIPTPRWWLSRLSRWTPRRRTRQTFRSSHCPPWVSSTVWPRTPPRRPRR